MPDRNSAAGIGDEASSVSAESKVEFDTIKNSEEVG
jgi:hypothetical protein